MVVEMGVFGWPSQQILALASRKNCLNVIMKVFRVVQELIIMEHSTHYISWLTET